MPEKIQELHSIERVWNIASRYYYIHPIPDTPPASQLLLILFCTQRPKAYHLQLLTQCFRLLHRHRRRRLGIPWVGPIDAALKRLKLVTVNPGATSTLSASLFLCRCSDAFSSFTLILEHSVLELVLLLVLVIKVKVKNRLVRAEERRSPKK